MVQNSLKESTKEFSFTRSLLRFYSHEIYSISKRFKRRALISVCLGAAKTLFIILAGLLSSNSNELILLDKNLQFLSASSIISSLNQTNVQSNCLFFFLIVNSLIGVLFFYLLTHSLLQSYFESIMLVKLHNAISLLFSFLIQTYDFLTFFPSIYFSMQQVSNVMAIVCFPLTLLIGFMAADLNYDYSINLGDQFSRPFSSGNYYNYIIAAALISLIGLGHSSSIIFLLIYYMIDLIFLITQPFYRQTIQKYFLAISCYMVQILFTIKLVQFISLESSLITLISCIGIPISYAISHLLVSREIQSLEELLLKRSSLDQLRIEKLDRIMRLPLLQLWGGQSKLNEIDAILLKQISFISASVNSKNHEENDLSIDNEIPAALTQFSQDIPQTDSLYNQVTNEKIQELLKLCLKESFDKDLKRKKNGKLSAEEQATHSVFLIEIMGSFKQYWVLRQQEKGAKKSGIKSQQILESVEQTCFVPMNQAISKKDNDSLPFYDGFFEVIRYEKKLDDTFALMNKAITEKVAILKLMKSRLIELDQLIVLFDSFREQFEGLKKNLNELFHTNNQNYLLLELQTIYLEIMAFTEKDIRIKKDSGFYTNSQKHMSKMDKKILKMCSDRFSADCCMVAAQFDDCGSLTIKQVSSNFFKIFNSIKQKEDIINRKLDSLIPSFYQAHHWKYVSRFIGQKCEITQENEEEKSKIQNMIFGSFQGQILVPFQIDVKLNELLNIGQFGLCTKICRIKTNKSYILFNDLTYQIVGVTQRVNQMLFSSNDNIPQNCKLHNYFLLFQGENATKLKEIDSIDYLFIKSVSNAKTQLKRKNNGAKQTQQLEPQIQISHDAFLSKQVTASDTSRLSAESIDSPDFIEGEWQFLLMTVSVKKLKYDYIDDISVLEISKVKQLSLEFSYAVIQHHLEEQLEILTSVPHSKFHLSVLKLQKILSLIKRNHFQISNQENQIEMSHSSLTNNTLDTYSNNPTQNTPQNNGEEKLTWQVDENIAQLYDNLEKTNRNQLNTLGNSNTGNQKQTNEEEKEFEKKDRDSLKVSQRQKNLEEILNIASPSFQSSAISQQKLLLSPQTANEIQMSFATTQRGLFDPQYPDESALQQQSYISDFKGSPGIICNLNQQENEVGHLASLLEKSVSENLSYSNQSPNNFDMNDNQGSFTGRERVATRITSLFSPQSSPQNNSIFFQEDRVDSNQEKRQKYQKKKKTDRNTRTSQHTEKQRKLKQISGTNNHASLGQFLKVKDHNIPSKVASNTQQQYYHASNQTSEGDDRDNNQNEEKNYQQQLKEQFLIGEIDNEQNRKSMLLQQRIHDQQNDIASNSSKKSNFKAAKRQLRTMMSSKNSPFAIKMSMLIGICSFLIQVIIISAQYSSQKNLIITEKNDKYFSTWPIDFQSGINTLVKDNNILLCLAKTDFKFANAALKSNFQSQIKSDLFLKKDLVIDLIAQTSGVLANQLVFKMLKDTPNTFQFGQYYNPLNMKGAPSVPAKYIFYSVPYNTTVHFSIILSYQHTFRYAVGLGTGRPEYYMILNNLNFHIALNSIEAKLLETQQASDLDQQNQMTYVMIIFIIISGLCVSIIIPLYWFIQRERETVIQLFATFNSQKVDSMIASIKHVYESNKNHFNGSSLSFNPSQMAIGETRKNTQNISQMTRLPHFSSSLMVKIFIVFGIVIIYPILNRYFFQQYLNEETVALRTTINLYSIKGYIVETLALHYNNLYMKLYPTVKPIQVENYLSSIQSLLDQSDYYQQKILTIIEEQSQYSRHSQPLYNDFFYQILKGDMCTAFGAFPQFVSNSTIINQKDCTSLNGGFLKKGIQVALKAYLSIFPLLNTIYLMKNPSDYQPALKSFLATFNMYDFTKYQEFIEQALVSLRDFQLKMSQINFDYISALQQYFLIYQLTLLCLIFLFGWIKFIQNLKQSIFQSKRYLSIIDITSLLENNYVLTYIKKNTRI